MELIKYLRDKTIAVRDEGEEIRPSKVIITYDAEKDKFNIGVILNGQLLDVLDDGITEIDLMRKDDGNE